MDDLTRWTGAMILRDRWKGMISLAEEQLQDPTLSETDRAATTREKAVYEIVLHELISRLGLPED